MQARKGLGTNSVGLATELSLVSKLLQKVIPKKISACGLCTCTIPDSKWRSIIATIRPLGIGVVPVDTVKHPGKWKENITP